jgi:hypothetical protein
MSSSPWDCSTSAASLAASASRKDGVAVGEHRHDHVRALRGGGGRVDDRGVVGDERLGLPARAVPCPHLEPARARLREIAKSIVPPRAQHRDPVLACDRASVQVGGLGEGTRPG